MSVEGAGAEPEPQPEPYWATLTRRVYIVASELDQPQSVKALIESLKRFAGQIDVVRLPAAPAHATPEGVSRSLAWLYEMRELAAARTRRAERRTLLGVEHGGAFALLLDAMVSVDATIAIKPRIVASGGEPGLPWDASLLKTKTALHDREGNRMIFDTFDTGLGLRQAAIMHPLAASMIVTKDLHLSAKNAAFNAIVARAAHDADFRGVSGMCQLAGADRMSTATL